MADKRLSLMTSVLFKKLKKLLSDFDNFGGFQEMSKVT